MVLIKNQSSIRWKSLADSSERFDSIEKKQDRDETINIRFTVCKWSLIVDDFSISSSKFTCDYVTCTCTASSTDLQNTRRKKRNSLSFSKVKQHNDPIQIHFQNTYVVIESKQTTVYKLQVNAAEQLPIGMDPSQHWPIIVVAVGFVYCAKSTTSVAGASWQRTWRERILSTANDQRKESLNKYKSMSVWTCRQHFTCRWMSQSSETISNFQVAKYALYIVDLKVWKRVRRKIASSALLVRG